MWLLVAWCPLAREFYSEAPWDVIWNNGRRCALTAVEIQKCFFFYVHDVWRECRDAENPICPVKLSNKDGLLEAFFSQNNLKLDELGEWQGQLPVIFLSLNVHPNPSGSAFQEEEETLSFIRMVLHIRIMKIKTLSYVASNMSLFSHIFNHTTLKSSDSPTVT